MNDTASLTLRGVSRRFGGLLAVDGVDMHLPRGARRALLGPNGAGKTTLVNLISGALPLTSGSITLFGADVSREPGRRRVRHGLARTYQQSKVFSGLPVETNIELALIGADGGLWRALPGGRRSRARHERACRLAVELGLVEQMGKPAGALSHGGKRQLELAMALACEPRLLVLDEPAAGLSPSERQMLTDLLLRLDPDLTLLLIEHDMNVALAVTDSVTVMADGRVVAEGTPEDVVSSRLVQDLYLGTAHG
ncbi:ABC transporter ATP-binding protein [Sphaerisporangium perillae]|uniref:ABC transporter ATP-binding protein n=1 Tax=Sphaerisporangium perillae TaxID=2935860 RepID=UPI00200CE0A3|nr:ATP-binding cassette domain-containing protein [Sphaerisporangium perillae]